VGDSSFENAWLGEESGNAFKATTARLTKQVKSQKSKVKKGKVKGVLDQWGESFSPFPFPFFLFPPLNTQLPSFAFTIA
jgi:hypothetical protein